MTETTTFNIPENVIKAAFDAFQRAPRTIAGIRAQLNIAIQACLKEWGAEEERRGHMFPSEKRKGITEYRDTERRLAFPWEPVERDEQ